MSQKRSFYERLPFFYGWLIFLATSLSYMFMYGLRYSVGVFFVPLQDGFGWTGAMTAGAVTVFFWVYGFAALFVGRLCDRIGVRKTVSLGGGLFPLIGGYLSDLTGSYYASLLFLGTGMLGALMTILPVKPPRDRPVQAQLGGLDVDVNP